MILFSVLMLAAQATATPSAVQPTPPAASPAKVKEKKVCRIDPESDPASHMVKRICRTQQEWGQQGVLGSSRAGFSISGDKMQGR